MGGKSGTSKSTVSIPPQVLARYNAVNAYAQDVAKTPFQPYSGQFVAGLTPTQQAGIQATSAAAGQAQPYFNAATQQLMGAQQSALPGIAAAYQNVGGAQDIGSQYAQMATGGLGAALSGSQPYQAAATMGALAGGQSVSPEQLNIGAYMSPYTQNVAQATYNMLNQQQGQQRAQQQAQAVMSGAFGGDRANLAAAQLAGQQQLAMAGAMAPIYQQGYAQALGAAQQQQGVGLAAEQANRAAQQQMAAQLLGIGQAGYGQQLGVAQQLAGLGQQQYGQGIGSAQQLAALAQQGYGMGSQTAQQLAGLGTGAQQAALQGAQAQIGAGTLEQQTQQADLTAQYQQFLQQRGYPFQVAQFLANIAMGTGALSGSTTTSQYPMPFFSDERLKENIKEIGKTHDGQPIYSFNYKNKAGTQIGLMAQDVEKTHPEAVYETEGGIKAVDYKAATKDAEMAAGGVVPEGSMGGAVLQPGAYNRGGYATDGGVDYDPDFIREILMQQKEGMGPFAEGGIYGQKQAAMPYGGKGIVPESRLPVARGLMKAAAPKQADSTLSQVQSAMDTADRLTKDYSKGKEALSSLSDYFSESTKAPLGMGPLTQGSTWFSHGGIVPRDGYALTGTVTKKAVVPGEDGSDFEYFPEEVLDVQTPSNQPDTPPSQSGGGSGASGLGTALSLGKMIIGLFKDGGVIPRGHLADGGIYDPIARRLLRPEETTQTATADEDIYSRELNPAVAPRFRQFEKYAQEGGAGIKPIELYRTPERSAFLSQTMPEGAPVAEPYKSGHNYRLAVDYAGVAPSNLSAMREAAAKTGLTLGADFSKPDLPHVQYGKGSFGGLYPQGENVKVGEGFGTTEHGGVVPEEATQAAYDRARSMIEAKGIDPDSSKGQSMMSGVMDYMRKNQEWMVPLGGFLKSMVQSRSPYLGGALLEGIGGGLEAVGTAQQQVAQLGLTRAEAMAKSLGLIGQRYKMLPDGTFYDTVQNRKVSAEERNAEMRRLGLPVGAAPDVTGAARDVLQKSGISSETVPAAPAPAQEAPKAPVETTTEKKAPTEKPKVQMSDKYPDIPIVTGMTDQKTAEIYARAEQDPAVQSWKQRVDEYKNAADQAQRNADALRGINDSQSQTFQEQAAQLRTNMAEAQRQMLETRQKLAAPSLAKLEGQTRVSQERDMGLLRNATESFQKSQQAAYRLHEMRKNFETLPSSGWLSTGTFGEQKANIAKAINGLMTTFGADPAFSDAQIAAGEAIKKDTVRLGEDLARSLGNNQAAAIVQGSINATPGLQNTEKGWKLLLGSLEQANQFIQDQSSFMNRYWEVNQTLEGAQEAFAEQHPIEQYVNQSIVSVVDPRDAEALRGAVGTKNEKAAVDAINKKYGARAATAILGQ